MDSEFEETDSSPPGIHGDLALTLTSFGRPTSAILPTPREIKRQDGETVRPVLK